MEVRHCKPHRMRCRKYFTRHPPQDSNEPSAVRQCKRSRLAVGIHAMLPQTAATPCLTKNPMFMGWREYRDSSDHAVSASSMLAVFLCSISRRGRCFYMEMFLVLTPSFNGQDERVFATPTAAFSYAKKQGYPERPEIVEIPVIGELEHPDTVYTVTWHDGTEDTQNVEMFYETPSVLAQPQPIPQTAATLIHLVGAIVKLRKQ